MGIGKVSVPDQGNRMTSENSEVFALKILFDREQISREKLEQQAKDVCREYLTDIILEVGNTIRGDLLLHITGSLEHVDACHREITSTLIGKLKRHHFRLIDEAGDEIRKQAYVILAEIEQGLRAFVNQSIVEVLGFEWWTSLGEVQIPGIDTSDKRKAKLYETHHPLELVQFDDLVRTMRTQVVQWEVDRTLSSADLLELLTESKTTEEIRTKLERKLERFSLWDDVFAHYFEDTQEWSDFRKELDWIISVRHKVMHHRPVHYGELKTLHKKKNELSTLLASKSPLSEQELMEIQQSARNLRDVYAIMIQSTAEEKAYDRLLHTFYESSDVEYVTRSLKEVDTLAEAGDLSLKEAYELRLHAFRKLQELTEEDSTRAEPLILQYLLPHTLGIHPDVSDVSIELYQLRERLADWLNQYPAAVRQDLRKKVLDGLYPHLQSSDPLAACWLVSRIGYRTDKVTCALWDIVRQSEDETGDTAIATLTSLGVPLDQRGPILSELHERVATRYSHPLASALTELADPTSIEVVLVHWLASDAPDLESIDVSLIFNVFRSVLDVRYEDAALQDKVWQCLTDLANQRPDEFSHEFYLGSTAPRCNSVLVVPTMLDWLGRETEKEGDLAWRRYLIGLRLEECVRPRQLEGWEDLHNAAAFEVLRQDACQDTGTDLYATTKEDMVKKKAWETLLRAAHASALNWFDEAVVSETGKFTQQKVIERFALFRFESLPEIIMKWITEEYDISSEGKDSRELARRIAAVRMARSSASQEAFDALLNFGLTSQGSAIMQSVYALTEVALHLIGKGKTSIVDELVEVVVNGSQKHQRVAAAYALELIAALGNSPLVKHAERLVPLLYDTSREPYERGTLISALGHLQGWEIPDKLLQDVKGWAHQPDEWVGGNSLDILARRGCLQDEHHLLSEVLSLEQVDEKWNLASNIERLKWAPYIIGLLYHDDPEAFTPAIASLVQTSDWLSVPQVFETLRYSHGEPDQPPLPGAIKDALIQRIREKQSRSVAEIEIFYLLADLAPKELADGRWDDLWDNWLPDSRAALADALGEASLESSTRYAAISHLQSLTRDGQYAVRRAAYRALARQSMSALHGLCLSWSSVKSPVELRQRAAEACGWLDRVIDEDGSDAFTGLYQTLVTDREKSVRETAERTWKEWRNRLWAEKYLSIVMNVKGETNKEILDAWRYGEALVRTGDDSCIQALREHLAQGSHPPNLRYWIRQIVEDMQENWRKKTQKWPDPWFAWEGTIEEGQGKVWISENKIVEVQYSIWSQPRAAPSELPKPTWGGAISATLWLLRPGDRTIELEDGRQGKIIVTGVSGDIAIFVGGGPYPT